MSASERLRALQEQLAYQQQQQYALLQDQSAAIHHILQGAQLLPEQLHAGHGGADELIAECSGLASVRGYASQLKDVAEQVRLFERTVRATDHLQPEDVNELVRLSSGAADAYAAALQGQQQLASTSQSCEELLPKELLAKQTEVGHRLQATRDLLHQKLSNRIHHHLEQCGWPPPIVSRSPASTQAEGATAAQRDTAFDPDAVFGAAHAEHVDALQQLMVALTQLQRVQDKEALDKLIQDGPDAPGSDTAPLLWAAKEVAEPLIVKLRHNFDNSAPGGRLDKPEWALNTVLRLAKEWCPRVEFLQSVVEACDLHRAGFHFSVEVARALRTAVKQLLRSQKLPALAAGSSNGGALLQRHDQQGQQQQQRAALWLHLVDTCVGFERQMAKLLGVTKLVDDEWLPAALLQRSTLGVLAENDAWMDAWLDAEAMHATTQLDAVLYNEQAWDKGATLIAEDRPAWRCVLWPTVAAEKVVALLETLSERVNYLPQRAAQLRYCEEVLCGVLATAHGRVLRMLQTADVFRDTTSLLWMPKVCSCICFCHYLERHLQELSSALALQLVEQPEPTDSHAPPDQTLPQMQLQPAPHPSHNGMPSPVSNGIGSPRGSDAGNAESLLARPLADFGSCKREWLLKLAKAVAQGFVARAHGYISREAAFREHDSTAADSGVVSAGLLDGLHFLQHTLGRLSSVLDSDCFRHAWRGIASTVNRELFNGVATAHIFSRAGAKQLATDAEALLRVFGVYTTKPRTHFRELLDSVALLGLSDQQAEWIHQSVAASSRVPNAADVLKTVGVYHLDPVQADTVLSLRMSG